MAHDHDHHHNHTDNPQAAHGRDKEFELDDPMEMHAVEIPGGNEEEQLRAFILEFLIMGASPAELIEIFKNPFYAGAHRLYLKYGEAAVVSIADEYYGNGGNRGNRRT
jgi:hypothetical protein